MEKRFESATLGVRAGQVRSQFNEHSEALYLTSSYVFDNAAQAAQRFGGGEGMVYTRYTNPTVAMFQDRLAAHLAGSGLEDGQKEGPGPLEVTAEGYLVPTGKLWGALPPARPQIHLDTVAPLEFISR